MVKSQTQFEVANIIFEDLNVKPESTQGKKKKFKIANEDDLPKKKIKGPAGGNNSNSRPSNLWQKIGGDHEWMKMADPPLPSMIMS